MRNVTNVLPDPQRLTWTPDSNAAFGLIKTTIAIGRACERIGISMALSAVVISTALAMGCGQERDNAFTESITAAQTITSTGTLNYDNECYNNSVPLPPRWGVSTFGNGTDGMTWKDNGTYGDTFFNIDGGHIYYAKSTQGICVINAHSTSGCGGGGTFDLICQGLNGKACFWEGMQSPNPPNTAISLLPTFLKGGTDLETGTPTLTSCPNCHAGENAFIAHEAPNHALNLGSLWMLPAPGHYMNPLVKADSIQNPVPSATQFAGWPGSPSGCLTCHVAGTGGRFPSLSSYARNANTAPDGDFCHVLQKVTNLPGASSGMPPTSTCDPNMNNCAAQTDPFVQEMLARCFFPVDPGTNPVLSSRGTGQLELFITSHGQVRVKTFNNGWSDWAAMPSLPSDDPAVTSPAAVSWGIQQGSSQRTDVFVVAQDGILFHNSRTTQGWQPSWDPIDCCLNSAPTVASWAANRLDVFGSVKEIDIDHNVLWHIVWDGNVWSGPETLFTGTAITSAPAAVSWSSNRIDLVARSSTGGVNQFVYSYGWTGPFPIGGNIDAGTNPGISSWGAGRLDIFAVTSGQVNLLTFANGWGTWGPVLSPNAAAGVGAVSWGTNRIDILTNDSGGTVFQGYSTSPPTFNGWYGI
jgi:hypothetical protein